MFLRFLGNTAIKPETENVVMQMSSYAGLKQIRYKHKVIYPEIEL